MYTYIENSVGTCAHILQPNNLLRCTSAPYKVNKMIPVYKRAKSVASLNILPVTDDTQDTQV